MARKESLFDNILDNSVNTGLKTNFQNAIVNAGVKVPASTGLWEYPEIIRKNPLPRSGIGAEGFCLRYGCYFSSSSCATEKRVFAFTLAPGSIME